MAPQRNDDARRLFRRMPVAEDDRPLYHGAPPHMFRPGPLLFPPPPPFPQNPQLYNAYHMPEYGNYYIAQPPEPFADHSFRFDAFQSSPQVRPPYPIPHPNLLPNNNIYPLPHLRPLPPNVAEANHPLMNPTLIDYQTQPPPPLFYPPRPPQMMPPPPIPTIHLNTTTSAVFPPGVKRDNPISSSNELPIFTSLSPSRRLTFRSFPKGRQSRLPVQPLVQNVKQPRRPNFLQLTERSALLEDFRSNRDKFWGLKDILGHIIEFSGDQYGSRFIQQNLQAASYEEKQKIFDEIVPSKADQLIKDVFGNYVIQKFFEFGSQAQKDILANIVQKQVISLSLHIYGCRVVQKAIDCVSELQQSAIIRYLEQDILTCIKDAHGNHVIQKLVEVVPPDRLTFLPFLRDNMLALATHPYGCRVLQRCLEHLPDVHTKALIQAIHACTLELMQDQYGNYVIQFIIQQGREHDKATVISKIQGKLVKLSQHKYASNVCEKALLCTDSETRHTLINEIMINHSESENPVLTMVKDQYANYVLQRALTVVEGRQREDFYTQVKPLLDALQRSTTSYNRPLGSIERLMGQFFGKQASFLPSASLEKSIGHGRSSC
ncbi:armadillo-type protein [Gymnopilus junonius]|uniref:Armadillo-type protein n=1 Tax=Gymnopilus junonius TaxID=109634 RepID=A0A9P5P0A2_GYMJU|nr:armadillo-type protein [Gymnopilus junonius]